LFVSQLHPRKNLQALRDAMVAVDKRGLPHALMIVGRPALDRRDGADLEASLTKPLPGRTNGVVRVLDPDDRALATLMADADVFCLPSLMEGFGLTALEAMACGTAVVACDNAGVRELLRHNYNGLLCAPETLAQTLLSVLTDGGRRHRLVANGLSFVKRFDMPLVAGKYRDLYRGICAAQGGPP
jgi:glycosyltransferase involved in cell wall biosynthesis